MAIKRLKALVLSLLSGMLAPGLASAQGTSTDPWQFTGALYLWGAGIDGKTTFGSDVSVSFGDIVDNLDFALMGALEAKKDKWMITGDLIYLKLSTGQSSSRTLLPSLPSGGFTVNRTTSVGVEGKVFQLMGGYELLDDQSVSLYGTFGARYLKLDTDLGFDITTPSGARSASVSASNSVWDGVVGLRGRANVNENWFIPFYGDLGTGQSDLTWQAFAGIGYNFGRADLVLGYRHLDWKFKDTDLVSDMAFSGPLLGLTYRF